MENLLLTSGEGRVTAILTVCGMAYGGSHPKGIVTTHPLGHELHSINRSVPTISSSAHEASSSRQTTIVVCGTLAIFDSVINDSGCQLTVSRRDVAYLASGLFGSAENRAVTVVRTSHQGRSNCSASVVERSDVTANLTSVNVLNLP